MIVRIIDLNDLSTHSRTIESLISECIETTYEVDSTATIIKEKMQSLRQHLKDGNAIVLAAFEGQTIVGFLWGYELSTITDKVIHVGYISVLREFRGRGVASAMLETIQNVAISRNISTIELIVGKSNISATNLYQENGYYVDRLIMRKKI